MTDFHIEEIAPLCSSFGITLDSLAVKRLNLYGNLLLEWNEKINLTAITEPREVLYKHFYDCILLLKNIKIPQNARIIDVGTGAGFPGAVLKIVRPDIDVTLLDGLNKRLVFLNEVIEKTELSGIRTLHLRAEEGGRNPEYREKYDLACARAVARLPVLLEYCLPFVKKGGVFVAMKGPSAEGEAAEAQNAVRILGGAEPDIICETLPENDRRAFITVKKISQTPPKYPRISAKISKQPL